MVMNCFAIINIAILKATYNSGLAHRYKRVLENFMENGIEREVCLGALQKTP